MYETPASSIPPAGGVTHQSCDLVPGSHVLTAPQQRCHLVHVFACGRGGAYRRWLFQVRGI